VIDVYVKDHDHNLANSYYFSIHPFLKKHNNETNNIRIQSLYLAEKEYRIKHLLIDLDYLQRQPIVHNYLQFLKGAGIVYADLEEIKLYCKISKK
jgi:hypothetical protein